MPPIFFLNYHLKKICHHFFQICQSKWDWTRNYMDPGTNPVTRLTHSMFIDRYSFVIPIMWFKCAIDIQHLTCNCAVYNPILPWTKKYRSVDWDSAFNYISRSIFLFSLKQTREGRAWIIGIDLYGLCPCMAFRAYCTCVLALCDI